MACRRTCDRQPSRTRPAAHATHFARLQAAPYPNTLDFLRLLRAEVGPAHDALITDLFEKITLVDAKTTRATAVKRPDGK